MVRTVQEVRRKRLITEGPQSNEEAEQRNNMGEPAVKVKADDIAAVFREEIRADVAELKAKGVHPTLVSFLATGDVAAKKYSEWTQKACEADGIKYEVIQPKGHQSGYEHQMELVGAKIITVETAAEMEAAINERTGMVFILNKGEPHGKISHAEVLRIAHAKGRQRPQPGQRPGR
jgi:hypothetical protein